MVVIMGSNPSFPIHSGIQLTDDFMDPRLRKDDREKDCYVVLSEIEGLLAMTKFLLRNDN